MKTPEPNLPLRVRVAELMGYSFIDEGWRYPDLEDWQRYKAVYRGEGFIGLARPDWIPVSPYDASRDAAMEAVQALLVTDDDKHNFMFELSEIKNTGWTDDLRECFALFSATPAEICEALLAALGKGEEG